MCEFLTSVCVAGNRLTLLPAAESDVRHADQCLFQSETNFLLTHVKPGDQSMFHQTASPFCQQQTVMSSAQTSPASAVQGR